MGKTIGLFAVLFCIQVRLVEEQDDRYPVGFGCSQEAVNEFR